MNSIDFFHADKLLIKILTRAISARSECKGGSVILAAVKTPDNKFARIIKPGRNMPAVKTPDKKFA